MRVTGVDACRRGWVGVTLEGPALAEVRVHETLSQAGVVLPPVLPAPVTDTLDAAAVAWSAGRIAAGQAAVLPARPQQDGQGREIAIRY